jgi:hypothetical protein
MGTPIATNDVLQVTAWSQLGPQASLNISGWKVDSVVGVPTLEDLPNAIQAALGPLYQPIMTNAAQFLGVIVKRETLPISGQFLSTGFAVSGTAGAVPAAAQTAAIATLRSGLPGRKNRGRKYFGFLDESMLIDAFNLTNAALTNTQTLATYYGSVQTWMMGATSVTAHPVVYHRTTPAVTVAITTGTAKKPLVTQRRRGAVGRPNTPPF